MLIEVQMRHLNGFERAVMEEGRERRLRRAVLEAHLLTLRAWTTAWRARYEQEREGGAVGVGQGGDGDVDVGVIGGALQGAGMERME